MALEVAGSNPVTHPTRSRTYEDGPRGQGAPGRRRVATRLLTPLLLALGLASAPPAEAFRPFQPGALEAPEGGRGAPFSAALAVDAAIERAAPAPAIDRAPDVSLTLTGVRRDRAAWEQDWVLLVVGGLDTVLTVAGSARQSKVMYELNPVYWPIDLLPESVRPWVRAGVMGALVYAVATWEGRPKWLGAVFLSTRAAAITFTVASW